MSDIRRVSLPYVSKPVEDLLMWRDPKKTGILFAIISGVYIYVLATGTPIASLAAYTSGFLVALSFLWANFGKHIGWEGPPLPAAVKHGLTDSDWRPISQKLKDAADKGLGYANRVLTGRDATASVVATLGLFAAGFLLARINLFFLSGFVTILAFTLPKVYELKKDDIDHKVMPKVREVYEIAYAKIKEVANKIPRAPARSADVPVSRPAEVPKKEQ